MAKPTWIHSPALDSVGILAPPFVAVALCLIPSFREREISPMTWLLFVVFIDVAHVYASLYRTYFDKKEFEANRTLYTLVPLVCWLLGVTLFSIRPTLFWTTLAYLAVFHFVRQQYGFLRLYSRDESPKWRWLDALAIYSATLYPLVYWHTHLPRDFAWFMEGDFLSLPKFFHGIALGVYALVLVAYVVKEIATKHFNVATNAVVVGTALSWSVGIVLFDSDFLFTVTNVVSHGIPYFTLVWISCRKRSPEKWFFSPYAVPLFLGALVCFAYAEEALWDSLVWRDHSSVFFGALFPSVQHKGTLSWLVPLLALPQATHYVLDGFIWRLQPRPYFPRLTSRSSAST